MTREPATRGGRLRRAEKIAFVAGLVFFGWLLFRIGAGELVRNLSEVGWGFALVFSLQLVPILLNSLSWRLMLPRDRRVTVRTITPMLLAGEAVNAVSPVGVVGGELLRVTLLGRRIPRDLAAGSVVLAAMTQFCAQILFVLSGLPVVWGATRNSALHSGLLIVGAILAAILSAVLFLAWSPRSLDAIKRALDRFGWFRNRWERVPERWRVAGDQMLRALRSRPGAFLGSVGASLLAWEVGVVETLIVLRLLHVPVGLARAVAIEVLAVTIEGALFFVPARIGTQEGGRVLIFVALGLDPAKGLTLGLVRRARELAWAAVGFAILGHLQRDRGGPSVSRVSRKRVLGDASRTP